MSDWSTLQSADWSGVVSSKERILWQGRPSAQIAFTANALTQSVFGAFFFGFSLFWIYMASSTASPDDNDPTSLFPLFGIPFALIGLYQLIGHFFWSSYVRGRTWYALTDNRALIMTRLFGTTSIKSFPIGPVTPVELVQGARSTIWFAEKQASINARNNFMNRKIGFELIEDGPAVYQLMRSVRETHS